MNPNFIVVPIVESGCCAYAFDPTYPFQLTGIITPDEYRTSIENINDAMPKKQSWWTRGIIAGLSMIGGFLLFFVGAILPKVSDLSSGLPIILGGVALIFFGVIFCGASYIMLEAQAEGNVRQVVARESSKYCQRLPTPCTWRVLKWTVFNQTYSHHEEQQRTYLLVIEIGNLYPQYPPSYNQTSTNVCSHCGAAKMNPYDPVCRSCGRS